MAKKYIFSDGKWREGLSSVKAGGEEVRYAKAGDFLPESGERLGETGCRARKGGHVAGDAVVVVNGVLVLRPYKEKGRFFKRRLGWARVVEDGAAGADLGSGDAQTGYVALLKVRKSAVVACILAAIAVLMLVFWALSGVAPQDQPTFLADQAGITHNNADAQATITYATYESTPDTTWKAGKKSQNITLRLPAETASKDADGKSATAANPVLAAPSIWVDLDGDGKFSDDECVFNAPSKDSDGNVIDPGKLLQPGKEIKKVTLSKKVPKGSYDAQTLWTSVSSSDGSPANPMTFKWKLKVR